MALASTDNENYVTVSSATQSDHISLPPGAEFVLEFTSAGAFALDVQASGAGSTFYDMYFDTTNKVTMDSAAAAPLHVRVPGGMCYRMDVDTYNNPITMRAFEC